MAGGNHCLLYTSMSLPQRQSCDYWKLAHAGLCGPARGFLSLAAGFIPAVYFYYCLLYTSTLSGSSLETALQHSFRAGIIALQVLLASSLGSNSRYGYTLQRLRVSERCV